MSKKTLLVIFCFILFFHSFTAYAGVIINEIQLYPTGDRFIELYNTDNTEINLTDYYLQRKTQTGTSFTSLVSKTNFVDKKIGANSYFLISRSAMEGADIVLSTLTLTESNTIQMKNGAGEVVDSLCFGDVGDCNVSISNPPEGQSISRVNDSWSVGLRSPGAVNTTSNASSSPNENVNSSNSTESVSSVASANNNASSISKTEQKSITTEVRIKNVSFVGITLNFEIKAYGTNGEELKYGKYFWNFGDGTTAEKMDNNNFTHTYSYAGEYLISVEYFANSYSNVPDVVNKIKIKVVPVELFISRTGDASDFFVEISNNSTYDIDISAWKLSANGKVFIFPRNTNILSKKKIILSSLVTHFTVEDKDNLELSTPDDKIVYSSVPEIKIVEKEIENNLVTNIVEKIPEINSENKDIEDDSKILTENLAASAINSDAIPEKTSNSYIFLIILFFFLILSGGAVYLIRRNGTSLKFEDDFEILDE